MAEAIRYEDLQPEPPTGFTTAEVVPIAPLELPAPEDPLTRLRTRSRQLSEWVTTEAKISGAKLKTSGAKLRTTSTKVMNEAKHDAQDARLWAQFYHESRPIQAVGAAAGAAFAFGLILGLWRD